MALQLVKDADFQRKPLSYEEGVPFSPLRMTELSKHELTLDSILRIATSKPFRFVIGPRKGNSPCPLPSSPPNRPCLSALSTATSKKPKTIMLSLKPLEKESFCALFSTHTLADIARIRLILYRECEEEAPEVR